MGQRGDLITRGGGWPDAKVLWVCLIKLNPTGVKMKTVTRKYWMQNSAHTNC